MRGKRQEARLIKKLTEERRSPRHIDGHGKRKTSPAIAGLQISAIVVLAVFSYLLGIHLRTLSSRPQRTPPIDAALITTIPSNEGCTILVETRDHHDLVVASDINVSAVSALLTLLRSKHLHIVNCLVLTNIGHDTGDGLAKLFSTVQLAGPLVTPIDSASLDSYTEQFGIDCHPWPTSASAVASSVPMADVSFLESKTMRRSREGFAVRVTYGDSSLLDIAGLTPRQSAGLTGESIGGTARLLMVNGDDGSLSRELLVEAEPDIVVLTGLATDATSALALREVASADAMAVNLSSNSESDLRLPYSASDSASSSQLP
jgi:hypothetical protein